MKPIVLDIKNLAVSFVNDEKESFTAIASINITIHEGETVAIVGESGSGKTVTSMSILQLHPKQQTKYDSGEILLYKNSSYINLINCKSSDLDEIRGKEIAMIFQEPMTALNPVITCGNQIAESLLAHQIVKTKKDAAQKALELLQAVQIPEPSKAMAKYPHEMSGGQKQRVMIAIALSCNPRLLICDEPTTALDVTVQKEILLLLKDLQVKFGLSLLFISHDLGVVKNIADKVVVMYKGKIVEQGDAEKVFNNPKEPYTKALLACRPSLFQKGQRLPTVSDFINEKLFSNIDIGNDYSKSLNTNTLTSIKLNLIEVKNLSVKFPTTHNFWGKATNWFTAIDQVNLNITKHQTIGLVGESGCGKTTLGRCLALLQTPTEGTIYFNQKPIDQNLKQYRKQVQMVFQDPYSSLNQRITIGQTLKEVLLVNNIVANSAMANLRIHELLDNVELPRTAINKYPHEFSGGQRQRIVIARALAMKPAFIICDESVSALDVSVQAQILNLLNALKEAYNFTNLFISHDLNVVRYISDYIYVMQKGKIVEEGVPDFIFKDAKNAYTQHLVSSMLA